MNFRTVTFLVLALAFTSSAFAQEDPSGESSAPSRDGVARARFEAGLVFYEEARYEEALAEFEAAWELSHRPEMLFNIANAAERSFDHARVVESLEEYLVLVPDTNDAEILRRRIERNRVRLGESDDAQSDDAQSDDAQSDDAQSDDAQSDDAQSDDAQSESRSNDLRLAGWLTITGAGAVGVASLVTGLVSHNIHSDLVADCSPTCPAERAGDIDRGRRLATVSTVLTGVALVAAISGIVLVIVGGEDGDDDDDAASNTEVAVLPSLGGASVRVRY